MEPIDGVELMPQTDAHLSCSVAPLPLVQGSGGEVYTLFKDPLRTCLMSHMRRERIVTLCQQRIMHHSPIISMQPAISIIFPGVIMSAYARTFEEQLLKLLLVLCPCEHIEESLASMSVSYLFINIRRAAAYLLMM